MHSHLFHRRALDRDNDLMEGFGRIDARPARATRGEATCIHSTIQLHTTGLAAFACVHNELKSGCYRDGWDLVGL